MAASVSEVVPFLKQMRRNVLPATRKGSGANGLAMKDDDRMRRFVSVETLFNGRHFDGQDHHSLRQLVFKFQVEL